MLKRPSITRVTVTVLLTSSLALFAWSQTAISRTNKLATRLDRPTTGVLAEDSCGCDPSKRIQFTPFTLAEIGGMMQPARPNLGANDVVTVGGQTATAATILSQMNDTEARLNQCGFSLRKGWDGAGPECKNELTPTQLSDLNAKKALVLGAHQWGRKGEVNPARNKNPGSNWTGGGQTQAPFPAFTNAVNSLSPNSNQGAGQTTSLLQQTSTGVTWHHPPIFHWDNAAQIGIKKKLLMNSGDQGISTPVAAYLPAPPPPPPLPVVTRSSAWDTNVIGRKDIYAADLHTELNLSASALSTDLDGELKLTLWQFNNSYVHQLTGSATVPQSGQEQASLTYQDPSGNSVSLYQHSGPFNGSGHYTSTNLNMQFYVGIAAGPVVIYVTFTPGVQVGYDYHYYVGGGNTVPATSVAGGSTWGTSNIRPTIAYGEFKPRATVTVNASAAVTFLFIVTAGLNTDLKLADWALELRGLAKLDFYSTTTNNVVTYHPYVGLYTEALDQILMMVNAGTALPPFGTTPSGVGSVNAFVTYPKLPQWFWNGSTRTVQRPIWSWNGIGASGWLVNYYNNYEQPF